MNLSPDDELTLEQIIHYWFRYEPKDDSRPAKRKYWDDKARVKACIESAIIRGVLDYREETTETKKERFPSEFSPHPVYGVSPYIEIITKTKRLIKSGDFQKFLQDSELKPPSDSPLVTHWLKSVPTISNQSNMTNAERDSMLKLIIGMGIDAYGYDPETDKKQKSTGEKAGSIHAALQTRGIIIDNQTIKKYLDEAKGKQLYMPQDQ